MYIVIVFAFTCTTSSILFPEFIDYTITPYDQRIVFPFPNVF